MDGFRFRALCPKSGWLWVLWLAPLLCLAQPEDAGRKRNDRPQAAGGVFGYVHTGGVSGFLGDLETELEQPGMFGEARGLSLPGLGSSYGGELWLATGRRWLFGLGASGYSYNRTTAASSGEEFGEVQLDGHQFLFRIGCRVGDREHRRWNWFRRKWEFHYRWMVFPMLSFGGGPHRLGLANFSNGDFRWGGVRLEPARRRTFTSRVFTVDAGVTALWFAHPRGGLGFGVQVGGWYSFAASDWSSEGEAIPDPAGLAPPVSHGVYLRVNVGGGWFWSSTDKRETQQP